METIAGQKQCLGAAFCAFCAFSNTFSTFRSTLATTCLRYGDTSVEYGNELLKFTDVLEAKLNSDLKVNTLELVKLLVKARNIFRMQYGETFSQVQEIQGKLDFFQRMGLAKEA